jgi:hypothetical protein
LATLGRTDALDACGTGAVTAIAAAIEPEVGLDRAAGGWLERLAVRTFHAQCSGDSALLIKQRRGPLLPIRIGL